MSLHNTTKWLFCLVALYSGPLWSPARSVTVKTPPKVPSTIEAQAKFFQDFFSVQLSPYKIEFGHVCEDPNTWEQRYEKKDFKNHRDMGKVRWGDKKGGYGEHYWDLNHAGHADNHGDDKYGSDSDDGSYRVHDNEDPYDEPSENKPNYDTDYDPEKSSYEESGRAKRAHPKIKAEEQEDFHDIPKIKPKLRKTKDSQPAATKTVTKQEEEEEEEEEVQEPKVQKHKPRRQFRPVKEQRAEYEEEYEEPKNDKAEDTQEQPTQYVRSQAKHFVPYENGAGVRQHQTPEVQQVAASVPVPRLFLEPSTGHVVDRATGQAYVLQPIVVNY